MAYSLYGPSLQGADFEMGRVDQIPYNTSQVTADLKWTRVLAKIDSSIEARVLVHSPSYQTVLL